jgi:hypothetical protein
VSARFKPERRPRRPLRLHGGRLARAFHRLVPILEVRVAVDVGAYVEGLRRAAEAAAHVPPELLRSPWGPR